MQRAIDVDPISATVRVQPQYHFVAKRLRAHDVDVQNNLSVRGHPVLTADDLHEYQSSLKNDTTITSIQESLRASLPDVGDLKWSARNADSNGWMVCDGRNLGCATHPQLFAVIGYDYGGSGDYFNLPDARGRVVAGVNGSHRRGESLGAETHALKIDELPSHGHVVTVKESGAHVHQYNDAYSAVTDGNRIDNHTVYGTSSNSEADHTFRWRQADGTSAPTPGNLDTSITGTHSHTAVVSPVGGDRAHNNLQPTLFAGNLLIFTGP